MDDPDGRGGYRGWADRLAEHLAAEQGSILYANLAIRGRTTRQVREEQLAPALAMRPDLVTITGGTNDVLRPRFEPAPYADDLSFMQKSFVDLGATVLTFTLPDLTPVMPLARILGDRVFRLNDAIREACARSGAICVDVAAYPVASDPRLWSDDRLHANSLGHARIADALLHHLGRGDHTWSDPLPPAPPPTVAGIARAEWAWTRRHLLPWIWRHLRGRSSGDGITAKRPQLTEMKAPPRKCPAPAPG